MASNEVEISDILPQNYEYLVTKTERLLSGLSTTIRISIRSKEDALNWITDYENQNHVSLRVLQTYEGNTSKISFKKEFRCIHNTRPQKGSTPHSKHTNCAAKVIVTLKNQNMKRSKDVYLKTHPCEIYIRHTHNHALYSSTVLKYRPPAKELEVVYQELFTKGHSPSSALTIFKDKLFEEYANDKYYEVVADGQKCPTQKWVYDLYYSVFKKEYGEPTGIEIIASLEDFVDPYNKKCGDLCEVIQKDEDNLAVAICSPIMKRIHENIKSSSEVMFVDSSGNMDRHNTRVFLFLCPSCVGALPLGVLFLYSESERSITMGSVAY